MDASTRTSLPFASDPALDVRTARDRYLEANGFSIVSYDAPHFVNYIGPFAVKFKNPGLFRQHDLHHVATGYGTDLIGEGEISAYELRAGCPSTRVRFLCLASVLIAFLLAPRRILRALRCARSTRTLYTAPFDYEAVLAGSVAELRRSLLMPEHGFADRPAGRRRGAPPTGAATNSR